MPAQRRQVIQLAEGRPDLGTRMTAEGTERPGLRPTYHDPAQRTEPLLRNCHRHPALPVRPGGNVWQLKTLTPAARNAHRVGGVPVGVAGKEPEIPVQRASTGTALGCARGPRRRDP